MGYDEYVLRAIRTVRDIPIAMFGSGHVGRTRKFVLLLIASDIDGENYTLTEASGIKKCSLLKVIQWLHSHGFTEFHPATGVRLHPRWRAYIKLAEADESVSYRLQ